MYKPTAKEAEMLLQKGNVILAETETVTGLLANAETDSAVEEIFAIKKRKPSKPLSVTIPAKHPILKHIAIDVALVAAMHLKSPQPLTLILPFSKNCRPMISKHCYSEDDNFIYIGWRMFKCKHLQFLSSVNFITASSSANISGEMHCDSIAKVHSGITNEVSYFMKSEDEVSGFPSKIIKIFPDNSVQVIRD